MVGGTKGSRINCIIVNSEVAEIDMETNEKLEVGMEVDMGTEEMMYKLTSVYEGWEVIKQLVKPLEYQITRNEKTVLMKTNAITFVVKNDVN